MRVRKARTSLVLAVILISIFLISCDHNVYMPYNDTWSVLGRSFGTFSQALDFLMANQGISRGTARNLVKSTVPWERTIYLLRDVGETERGEAIVVPETFEGELCINFNGHEYWFYTDIDEFLDIRGGDRVDIINGKTVITENTASRTAALCVDVRVVTVDEHLIDDRRKDPQAITVGCDGTLVVTSSSGNRTDCMFAGSFAIETGGILLIDEGFVYISDINDINPTAPGSFVITGGKVECPHIIEIIATDAVAKDKTDNVDLEIIHDFERKWEKVITAPSCTAEGLKQIHCACSYCDAVYDEFESIGKLEHQKVWSNDSHFHWAECAVCGHVLVEKEPHSFVSIGSTTYCVDCGYVPQDEGGAQSGFDVTAEDLIPAGHIIVDFDESTEMYSFTLVSTNPESEPEHFIWYLDDNLQADYTSIHFTTEIKFESFTVMCVFWNAKGTGSASVTVQ